MKQTTITVFLLLLLISCMNGTSYAQDIVSLSKAKLGFSPSSCAGSVTRGSIMADDAVGGGGLSLIESSADYKITISGTYSEMLDGGKKVVFSGGVTIVKGDMIFYASTVVHNVEENTYYAEEGVSISHPKFLLSCDKIWLTGDFSKAYARNVRVIIPKKSDKFSEELYIVFLSEESALSSGKINASCNKVSASTIIPPQFYFEIPDFSIDENGNVRAENAMLRFLGIPLLYIPTMSLGSGGGSSFPVTVDFGRKSYLGLYTKLQVRLGSTGNFTHYLLLGGFAERGVGVGLLNTYRFSNSYGSLRSYFINDGNEGEYVEKRYQFEYTHRTDFSFGVLDDLTLTVELHERSDLYIQYDFFRNQWLLEKEPHSYVNLQQSWDSSSISLFAQATMNNFDPDTEYFPEASWVIYGKPLLGCLFALSTRMGYLGQDDDEYFNAPDTFRAVSDLSIFKTFTLDNVLAITPMIGARGAFYDSTISDEEEGRGFLYTGVALATRLVGTPYFSTGGKNRRSVIHAKIELLATTETDDFPIREIYDSYDVAYEDVSINLVLTNVLEEKRSGEDDVFERFFLRLENKVNFTSQARDVEADGNTWGYLNATMKWFVGEKIYIHGDFDFDWYDTGFPTVGARLGYNITEMLSFEVGGRYLRACDDFNGNDATDTDVVLRWDSGGKWFYRLGYSRLFSPGYIDDFDDMYLTVFRRGRDFTVSVTVGNDNDGTYAYFSAMPRCLSRLSTRLSPSKYE